MKIYSNYHTKDLSITYYILSGIKSKTCNRGEMEDGRRGIWMGILSFTEHGGKGKRWEPFNHFQQYIHNSFFVGK